MTTKHTPEPWVFNGNGKVYVNDAAGRLILTVGVTTWWQDAARLVVCVNACAGMADPAAELAALRAERDELRAALKDLVDEIPRNIKFNVRKHYSLMVYHTEAGKLLARAALARCEKGGD